MPTTISTLENVKKVLNRRLRFITLLTRFVTMNEYWIHHYDADSKIQRKEWTYNGSQTPKKFKIQPLAGKILLSKLWNSQGEISVNFLQKGETMSSDGGEEEGWSGFSWIPRSYQEV